MTTLLEASGLAKEYDGRRIFGGLSLQLDPGEKVGLIGRNGTGKSTLMKILAGLEEPSGGGVRLHLSPERVGYLHQEPAIPRGLTVRAYLSGASSGNDEPGEWLALRYLAELGFSRTDHDKPTEILSGGEKSRLCLARLLGKDCDLLLLDEPTTHLDTRGLEWLEEYLQRFRGAAVIVSHDRHLLDETVHRILELDRGAMRSFPGSYSDYARIKDEENRSRWDAYHDYRRERKRIKAAVNRKKQWARQAAAASSPRTPYLAARAKKVDRVVKSFEERLDRLEVKAPRKPWEHRRLRLDLPDGEKTGTIMIHGEGLGHAFGGRVLWEAASFTIFAGDSAVLVGPNGAGKTTLLRLILGEIKPDRGRITLTPGARAGYLGQDPDSLNPELTPLETVIKAGEKNRAAARQLLGALLFRGDQVHQKAAILSGGELKRLALAAMLARRVNLLIMDEPTNHLDIESREAVEAALDGYEGTILAVSHDRYFLHRLSGRVLALEGGRLLSYPGSYGEYRDSLRRSGERNYDQILVLENRLSYLSGKLGEPARDNSPAALEERERMNREFLEISRKLRQLKDSIL